MSVQELIAELRELDVRLWIEGEKLRYSAPQDVMTEERLKRLVENKQAIIDWLSRAIDPDSQGSAPVKSVARDQPIQASFAQERLLFISSLMPGSDSYNVPLSLKLVGQLNRTALQDSLNAIVARHESLRTSFMSKDGQHLQVIKSQQKLTLVDISLTEYVGKSRDKKLQEIIAKERAIPFDLSTGPVIRATLVKLSANEYALLITLHHIVCDGWSLGILFKDLGTMYEAYSAGSAVNTDALAVQYADFSVWQRQLLSGASLESQVSYWRKKLDGLTTLQLPADFSRPQLQTFEGGQIIKVLPEKLSSGIKALSEKTATTLFMTMLASFNVLLYRYCGQDDIVIGTPIANRNRIEIEEIIGFFVNMLVIRSDMSDSPTFDTLLKRVKASALEAYQYQDLPFEKLVEELNTERDLSRNPLFQVSFAMQNAPDAAVQLQGLSIQSLQVDEATTTRFDLEVNIMENEGRLVIACIYNTRLFRKNTVENMLQHYQELLKNIVADPQHNIDTLQMLSNEERQKISKQWNQTQQPKVHHRLLHQSVEEIASAHPSQPAVIGSNNSLDYEALNQAANQLAHYLIGLGVNAEVPVTVLMKRTPEMVIALLAILKAGSHYVPVDPEYPDKRLAYILQDTKSTIVITQTELAARLDDFSGKVIDLANDAQQLQSQSTDNPDVKITKDQNAYIIYTSGSTGEPKGVEISHAALGNLVSWHQREYKPGLNDRASHLAGLGFDASVWELWPYLSCGCSLYLVPDELRLSASALWQWIIEQRISLSFMPTPLAEAVLTEITVESLRQPSLALRVLLTGGDKLHGALSQHPLPFRVVNHYGPTESAVVATCIDVDVLDEQEPAIGRPIDNVQVYILDGNLQVVPVGVTGILYIGGDSLAKGYLNQPALNKEKFISNPFSSASAERLYNTGDLAKYREDGLIEFSGRNDKQIKLRGFRIEPGEIEAVINSHLDVQSAVVLLHTGLTPSAIETKQLIAYVVLNDAADCDENYLLVDLQDKLPVYMVPSAIIFVDEFPMTANGKIDRDALPSPQSKNSSSSMPAVADSKLEKSIESIWCELLELEHVGSRDNFFDLGGHSLLLGKLHARLKEDLNAEIAIVDLFRYTTVESLARYIGSDTTTRNITDDTVTEQIERRAQRQRESNSENNDVAVIGMAGQFPGASDIDSFWDNLINGVESIHFYSDEELTAAGIPESVFNSPEYVPARGYLDDADLFDATFFAYSPREAELIDPQQRLFLETSWHALEHAACDPQTYPGLISVFAGTTVSHYLHNLQSRPELMASAGMEVVINNEKDFLATRISYKLDLKGPSFTLQTACSTSLVAIHEACRKLSAYDCDIALAGGVSINVPRVNGYAYQPGSILSPDGHCRPFDAKANGTVGGEGVGVVVLKRLADAVADRDTIHAVIKGSAINNDGADKAGFTAPGIHGQVNVITMAQAAAEVSADTIDYIETHGTGTTLGDPIEVSALTQVFEKNKTADNNVATIDSNKCAIGAVKSNIGHLDAAAGVAGFIKTVLSLENEKIPPSLHYTEPNPEIDFDNSPFYVNNVARDWPVKINSPRRAGVSSFGIGGTNAHVILEQAPTVDTNVEDQHSAKEALNELIVLSAKTGAALEHKMQQLAEHIQSHADDRLQDIALTLQTGRSMFEHRCMLVCDSADVAIKNLQAKNSQLLSKGSGSIADKKIVFMFSGQGSQYPDMAKDLYLQYAEFRHNVDNCCAILRPHIETDLLDLLFPQSDQLEHAAQQLMLTQYAQCSLFVIEYATAKLWMSWGIGPSAMIGHSIGEYVAACLSGVITVNDALVLVANRGRLMQAQPTGSMLSVPMSADEMQVFIPAELKEYIAIATINAPGMCVVSGENHHIEKLEQLLKKANHDAGRLHTSHAFHSPMMQSVLEPFVRLFDEITLHAPEIPFLSNLTGNWIKDVEAMDASYWGKHLRNTVFFSDGLKVLMQEGFNCYIETGPGNTLSTFARQHIAFASAASELCILTSIRHPRQSQSDHVFIKNSLGQLWLSGHTLDWSLINLFNTARRIPLPVYPFERKRYWIEPNQTASPSSTMTTNLLHKNKNISDWAYIPVWKSSLMYALDAEVDMSGRWIIFANDSASCQSLLAYLEQRSADVIRVTAAYEFVRLSESHYSVDPGRKADYDRLFADDNIGSLPVCRIIHCWGLSQVLTDESTVEDDEDKLVLTDVIENEYYSLLFMMQAMQLTSPDLTVRINVLTQFSQSVTSLETIVPEKSMLAALLKVLSQEIAGLSYNICDVLDEEVAAQINQRDEQSEEVASLPAVMQSILSVFLSDKTNRIDAYRFNRRWVQSHDRVALPEKEGDKLPLHLRAEGVYLITGGTGGVGLSIAHYLAEKTHAKIVLTARTSIPERDKWSQYKQAHGEEDKTSLIINQIIKLEASGAEVMVISTDVNDLSAMKQLVDTVTSQYGTINGVIHAAGVVSGRSMAAMQSLTYEDCELQFSPKVHGLMVLKKIFSSYPLDFIMPVSSLSTILGGLGFSAYSAANQFMDSVCQQQHNNAVTHWLSVNWEGWQFSPEESASSPVVVGSASSLMMSVAEGQQVFERILNFPRLPQLIISTGDLDSRLKKWVLLDTDMSDGLTDDSVDSGSYERPDLSSELIEAETETQKQMVAIWGSLFNIEAVGIQDNFFELGGHSLLAVQAVAKIRDEFEVTVSIDKFLELGTVEALAVHIDALKWAAENSSQSEIDEDDRNEFEL